MCKIPKLNGYLPQMQSRIQMKQGYHFYGTSLDAGNFSSIFKNILFQKNTKQDVRTLSDFQ